MLIFTYLYQLAFPALALFIGAGLLHPPLPRTVVRGLPGLGTCDTDLGVSDNRGS